MELVFQVVSQVSISSLLISLLLYLNSQLLLIQVICLLIFGFFYYKFEKKNKYYKWVLLHRIYELILPFLKQSNIISNLRRDFVWINEISNMSSLGFGLYLCA
ncbi:unnamed protein product [Paramecium primaurelia]|uniref:Uncharacterized protein n=1 Tax=Paramecium primaurelia TaxID=5886 RepID=A0A8S1QS14_PARPR|nr:unnamed protein product [Paramecium primaurelia]